MSENQQIVTKALWEKLLAWWNNTEDKKVALQRMIIIAGAVFMLSLAIISSWLQRKYEVQQAKSYVTYVIRSLNTNGWDMAYDRVELGTMYLTDLMQMKNLTIYNLQQQTGSYLEIPELIIGRDWLSKNKFKVQFPQGLIIAIKGKIHRINFEDYELNFSINSKGIEQANLTAENIHISDWADIERVSWAGRIIAPYSISDKAPFIKTYVEVNHIKLNGLLDYPLSQNIDRIYCESDIVGKIYQEDNLSHAMKKWQANGGKIEIKDFTINWLPLLLVGKGEINLNKELKPSVELNTSSKALINLLDELNEKKWLDNKGVFVAKILLSNKAYKADLQDKYLTVTTPIKWNNQTLSVEKIPVTKAKR